MQGITPLQLWLAALLPTVFAIGTLSVSIIGLIINNSRFNSVDSRFNSIDNSINSRFNSVDARLLSIEDKVGDLRERITRVEMR